MGKLSRMTKARMQCYEFKMSLNDFVQRIINSVNTAASFQKTTLSQRENPRRRTESQKRHRYNRGVTSTAIKTKTCDSATSRRKFYSDRELKQENVLRLPRSKSTERYDQFHKRGLKTTGAGKTSNKRSNQKWRKQRSSLTRRKSSASIPEMRKMSPYRASMKTTRTPMGDIKTVSCDESRKSVHSTTRSEARNSTAEVIENQRKRKKHLHRESSVPAERKRNLEKNTQTDEIKQLNDKNVEVKEEDPDHQPSLPPKNVRTRPAPEIISQYQQLALLGKHNGGMEDGRISKPICGRLASLMLETRKRKQDIDSLPPKWFKFGFQLTPRGEKIRKNRKDVFAMGWNFPFFKPSNGSSQSAPQPQDDLKPPSYTSSYNSTTAYPTSLKSFSVEKGLTGPFLPDREAALTQQINKAKANETTQNYSTGLVRPAVGSDEISSHFRAIRNKVKTFDYTTNANTGNLSFPRQGQKDNKDLLFPHTFQDRALEPVTTLNCTGKLTTRKNINSNSVQVSSPSAVVTPHLNVTQTRNLSKNTITGEHKPLNKVVINVQQSGIVNPAAAVKRYSPKSEFTAKFSHLLAQN